MRMAKTIITVSIMLWTSTGFALDAPIEMVPAGLAPGTDFYIMFVTSTSRNTTSTSMADYDAFVNAAADLSSVKGTDDPSITWRALGATAAFDQCGSWYTATAPVYNLNGSKLANNKTELFDGTIGGTSINYDESGSVTNYVAVFTGCTWYGARDASWFFGASSAVTGVTFNIGMAWIQDSTAAATTSQRFYAASPLLTVPTLAAPTFEGAFSPGSITLGDTSTLTFTVTNPNASGLTGLNFTNAYPAGIANTNPLVVGGTCGSITHSAIAGGNSFNLTGASIGASTTCTVTVNVSGTSIGTQTNTAVNIGSTESGAGTDAATANLIVTAVAIPIPTISAWGLGILAGLLGLMGFVNRRKALNS